MQHDTSLRTIRDRAGLDSTTTAAAVTAATLCTLAEKLSVQEVSVLVGALPGEFARVIAAADDGPPLSFGPEEFVERVRERGPAAVDAGDAERHVRVVFDVLAARLDHDEWQALRARLAPGYGRLYEDAEPVRLAG
jgi:uncharacterized protein (DUF2267 family)